MRKMDMWYVVYASDGESLVGALFEVRLRRHTLRRYGNFRRVVEDVEKIWDEKVHGQGNAYVGNGPDEHPP